jgi:hypothetical protein
MYSLSTNAIFSFLPFSVKGEYINRQKTCLKISCHTQEKALRFYILSTFLTAKKYFFIIYYICTYSILVITVGLITKYNIFPVELGTFIHCKSNNHLIYILGRAISNDHFYKPINLQLLIIFEFILSSLRIIKCSSRCTYIYFEATLQFDVVGFTKIFKQLILT